MKRPDRLSIRAKREGYPARSVYKLKELDAKYRLLKRGDRVLDLGCHPGAWLRYAAQKVGKNGLVVGVDLKEPKGDYPGHVHAIVGDVLELDPEQLRQRWGPFHAVLSDLAPKLTGARSTDMARSLELNEKALDIALVTLKPGGFFLVKVFHGSGFEDFLKKARGSFQKTIVTKPRASSKRSRETYLLGMGPAPR